MLEIPIVDVSMIPYGMYCWFRDGSEIKVCPYYGRIKEHDEGGYCALKGVADWHGHMGLLWDQVKECDHNID